MEHNILISEFFQYTSILDMDMRPPHLVCNVTYIYLVHQSHKLTKGICYSLA